MTEKGRRGVIRAASALAAFNGRMCTVLSGVIGAILAVICAILFYSVVMRYALNRPVTWTEDASTILMVWMVLLGAPIGLRSGAHVSIEFLVEKVSGGARTALRLIALAVTAYVALMMVRHGWLLAVRGMRRIVSTMEWLPFGYAYAALPVGYALMVLVCVEEACKQIALLAPRKGA